MTELIVGPDVEADLVTVLADGLADLSDAAEVATNVPNPRPPRFVKVTRVGGISPNIATDAAQILVECWDATDTGAWSLVRLVRAIAQASADGGMFRRYQELSGPTFFPDPATTSPRYQLSIVLTARMSAL